MGHAIHAHHLGATSATKKPGYCYSQLLQAISGLAWAELVERGMKIMNKSPTK